MSAVLVYSINNGVKAHRYVELPDFLIHRNSVDIKIDVDIET